MHIIESISSMPIDGSAESLRRSMSNIIKYMGFDEFCYVSGQVIDPTVGGHSAWRGEPTVLTTFPDEWLQEYHRWDYSRIDPAVRGALSSQLPHTWDLDLQTRTLDKSIATFVTKAVDFNVRRGVTIPIYGARGNFGLFSVVSHEQRERFNTLVKHRKHTLRLAALYFHERLREPTRHMPGSNSFTHRERQVLHWAAIGKTSAETGSILGISEKTTQFHLYNSMRKLNVHNKPQAIAVAIRDGVIVP